MSDFNGIEYLGADNATLQQDPRTGKTFHLKAQDSFSGPSLSGPTPDMGHGVGGQSRGIGGTEVGVERDMALAHAAQGGHPATRQYTPEELMNLANKMEQDLMQRAREAERPYQSSVEAALQRNPYGGSVTDNAPDWLLKYMEQQEGPQGPNMGMTQMGGPVDKVGAKKHLSQQEMLRHLKSQQ